MHAEHSRHVTIRGAFRSIRKYAFKYGLDRLSRGAHKKRVTEWFPRADLVKLPLGVEDEPVLFTWHSVEYEQDSTLRHTNILFTFSHALCVMKPIELKGTYGSLDVSSVRRIDGYELESYTRTHSQFAEIIAEEARLLLWRADRAAHQ